MTTDIIRLQDALTDLLDYADRHRISYQPDATGHRPCGCDTDCYERWRIESDEARKLTRIDDKDTNQ